MNSISIFSTALLALFVVTNALQCEPLRCRIMCNNGYEVDAEGCPLCLCRETPAICLEPISSFNCGGMDNQECPSSHECLFSIHGVVGECCLKYSGSTTASPATGASTARHATDVTGTSTSRVFKRSATSSTESASKGGSTARHVTGATGRSTRRAFKRLATFSTESATRGGSTARPATGASTARPATGASTARHVTGVTGRSTRRAFKRLATFSTESVNKGRSTARPATGASTARPATGASTARHVTGVTGRSTRRAFKRLATFSTESVTKGRSTARPATGASTARHATGVTGRSTSRLFKRSATTAQGSDSPASTTQSSVTTDQSVGQSTSTQY